MRDYAKLKVPNKTRRIEEWEMANVALSTSKRPACSKAMYLAPSTTVTCLLNRQSKVGFAKPKVGRAWFGKDRRTPSIRSFTSKNCGGFARL